MIPALRPFLPRLVLPCLLLAACAGLAPDAAPPAPGAWREETHRVPLGTGEGDPAMVMRVCRPAGAGPAPLALVNHGSPPRADDRPAVRAARCDSEAIAWFLRRGYVVAQPIRRGYGETGGAWAERFGPCAAPDYVSAGRETARDIAAALAYARALPGVRQDLGALVLGQSAGGWGAVALAADPPPGIAGLVSMAGGRGGWAGGQPSTNCRPDLLAEAAGRFGATARRVPMLWVYAANDSFFSPKLAAAMHQAFAAAGGQAEFAAMPAFGRDGHGLFFGREGSVVWGPVVARYLAARGLPAEPDLASAAAAVR